MLRNERGETFIEILITVVVLGIAVAGLVAAMSTSVIGTDAHRRLADSEVITRGYGETIKNYFLHPTTTTLAVAVTDHDPGQAMPNNNPAYPALSVASSTGFPTPPFYVTVDTEVMQVTAISGTTWTVKALGSGSHKSGASVKRYWPCPSTNDVQQIAFTLPAGIPAAKFAGTPTPSSVEYFDANGPAVSSGNCANYWKSGPSFCDDLSNAYFSQCDPPLVRINFTVTSTDTSASGRAVSTTSSVLLRRTNG